MSTGTRADAQRTCAHAMSAFAPLAFKVVGAPTIVMPLKLARCVVRVFPRPPYNCRSMCPSAWTLRKLSSVCMRVLRRVSGDLCDQRCAHDAEVRRKYILSYYFLSLPEGPGPELLPEGPGPESVPEGPGPGPSGSDSGPGPSGSDRKLIIQYIYSIIYSVIYIVLYI